MAKKPCRDCLLSALDTEGLIEAIGDHSVAVEKWLKKPMPQADSWLTGTDARLVDFDPLLTWTKVVSLIAKAERKALKVCDRWGELTNDSTHSTGA